MLNIRSTIKNEALISKRRAKIVESAIQVFLNYGYHNSTTKQLAEAAGMSEGNLYRYIGSKQDILHLICLTSGPQDLDELRSLASKLSRMNATNTRILGECIRLYVQHNDAAQKKHMFFNREIGHFLREDKILLLKSQVDHLNFFDDLIKQGIAAGEFKTENSLLMAHHILVIGFDWGLRQWFLKEKLNLQEYIEKTIDFVLLALRVPDLSSI